MSQKKTERKKIYYGLKFDSSPEGFTTIILNAQTFAAAIEELKDHPEMRFVARKKSDPEPMFVYINSLWRKVSAVLNN